MKKTGKDKLFSFLTLGLVFILMVCELACGSLMKPSPLKVSGEPAVHAEASPAVGESRAKSLQNDTPLPTPAEDDTSDAWSFVLAAGIGILLVAVVIGFAVKKRRNKGQ